MKFRGEAEQLGYFLTQVWNFKVYHGPSFLDNKVKVNYITMALEGEVANWVVSLHNVGTEELYDFDYFMITLRQWFEDPLADQKAKTRIKTI